MKKTTILLLLSITSLIASAQHATPQYTKDGYPILSLDDCIRMAIACDNDHADRILDSLAAEVTVKEAKSTFLPKLSASLSQSFDLGRSLNESGILVDESAGRTALNIEASYQLFSGLQRITRLDRAKISREASIAHLRSKENQIAVDVIGMYYQILMEEDMMRQTKAAIEETKYTLEYTQQMVDAGRWPLSKKLEIESQLANQRLQLIDQENRLFHTRHNLALNVDYGSADSLYIVQPDIESLVEKAKSTLRPMDDIYHEGMAVRADVKASQLDVVSFEKLIQEARTGYIPTLTFTAGYSNGYFFPFDEHRRNLRLDFKDQMKHNGRYSFTFMLSIPIFDAFQTHTQIRQAKIKADNARVQATRVAQAWYRTVSTAHANTLYAAKKIDIATEGANTAKKTLGMVQASFEAGRATALELEQARNRALSTEIQVIQAKYDFVYKASLLQEFIREDSQR